MILVFGSANMDLLMEVSKLPAVGETVLCQNYSRQPGGKGANQAIAASRAGAQVTFCGALGMDGFGDDLLDNFVEHGVSTDLIRHVDLPTGMAMIGIDDQAQNMIIVASGANHALKANTITSEHFKGIDLVVCQLEVPAEEVLEIFKKAKLNSVPTLLNFAPAQNVPKELFDYVDILIVNEIELRQVSTYFSFNSSLPVLDLARALSAQTGCCVVTTLGEKGALLIHKDIGLNQGVLNVQVVDSTGAGDAFVGVFASCYHQGLSIALKRASVAAGLACTKVGAQSALPTKSEIDQEMLRFADPVCV